MKNLKLSLTNKAGLTRRAIKRQIAKTKLLLGKFWAISRGIAQTIARMNMRMQIFAIHYHYLFFHKVVERNLDQLFQKDNSRSIEKLVEKEFSGATKTFLELIYI